ncbi:MAG: ComEC/Rec2-related protein [Caulobacter sp.]|nr:ComEC/Rec2-related protein [Caulobacter sp.]
MADLIAGRRSEIAAQTHRWFLWAPVAFAFGAAGYFALLEEPPLWLAAIPALAAIALAVAAGRFARLAVLAIPLTLLAFACSGALAAKLRTLAVAAPLASSVDGPRLVEGYVVDVASPGSGGARLIIAPVAIRGLAPEATPKRIHVSVDPNQVVPPGSAISLLAFVGPPPAPAAPGAYDFARDSYFHGVGGVGFTRSPIRTEDLGPAPWRLRVIMAINAARWSLARKIVDVMGAETGGMAVAMVTGHEVWITQGQVDDMRASGLAHILSISGLHMAIVGGFVFALVRLLIAAVPWLALRVPGKKVAAVVALAALGVYLVVSGWPPPAQRSAITAAVAFGAILADRRAITLHALAVAALLILIVQPEAACQPGFQMSFAATAALVALAEVWPHAIREISAPWWIRTIQTARTWLVVSVAASFVAGAATGPFAMQHFNRVAVYGLAANLAEAPISSFIVMPALAVGAALTPLGWGAPFLAIAGWGVHLLQALAHLFATAPGSTMIAASAPALALPVAAFGILFMCLWRGPMRLLGLPLALAVTLWPRPAPPDIWVASDGAAAAVREGRAAVVMRPGARQFASDLWSRRRGLAIDADPLPANLRHFDCNRQLCFPRTGASPSVGAWWWKKAPTDAQVTALCQRSEVVILRGNPLTMPAACQGRTMLTPKQFDVGGAAELYRRQGGGWRVVWAQPLRGHRPWTALEGVHD